MERFIKEYAAHEIRNYKENTLMQQEFKDEKIAKITKALKVRENGLITVDETMKIILGDLWKRLNKLYESRCIDYKQASGCKR